MHATRRSNCQFVEALFVSRLTLKNKDVITRTRIHDKCYLDLRIRQNDVKMCLFHTCKTFSVHLIKILDTLWKILINNAAQTMQISYLLFFYVINKTARCYIVHEERTAAALVDALQAVLSTISLNQLRTWNFWLSWLH